MKKLLLIICILTCYIARAQYNNEWIDYNKTYYKFPVGKNALTRISQPVLQSIGLANTPAEQFQLWRNGMQVPVYTSVASGILGSSDYIEFWGEMNDGKADAGLYPNINFQLCDKWSLETDTASYFLTVNPAGNNLRLTSEVNNVAANVLPAEQYFMHTEGRYFKDKINSGWAQIVTEYVYSSVYDRGEGYTSNDIYPGAPLAETMANLYPYISGPNATFTVTAVGNAANNRNIVAKVNGTTLVNVAMDAFYDQRQQATFPASSLSSGSANVEISNTSVNPNDRMVIGKYEITYPRQFNFGDNTNFPFELSANASGNYLRINFNYGAAAPILYDLTNYKRYTGAIDEPGIVKFALLPSNQKRKLVLVSQAGSNIVMVTGLKARNFVNYAQAANQGDYLIISNALLYTGANGNAVEAYRQYRSSSAGGGYSAKIYDIDQLTDQFAYGIKRHPFAIKKFLKYARTTFSNAPRYVFLIGKGVSYVQAKSNESNALLDKLNLVPPYGYPASDNLYASNDYETLGLIPIGRLSAVSANEVEIYLNKIKEYEAVVVNAPQTVDGRAWMKNIVHAIGGGSAELSKEIGGYMNGLKQIIEDTLYGANVESFSKTSAVATQLTSEQLEKLFAEGIGIVNYFGHSSSTTTEFNIDDPYAYQNQGKYPLFLVNGCLAGDIFNFETGRLSTIITLSEKYLLANERGAIGFIASTHFGIVNYLNIYLNGLYKAMSGKKYGASLGETLEESFRYLLNAAPGDYLARLHAEEVTLNGDPAVKFYTQHLPDYTVDDKNVSAPSTVSAIENNFTLKIKYLNIGRAVSDSFTLEVKRQLPNGTTNVIFKQKVTGNKFIDSLSLTIPTNPTVSKGENKFIITLDSDNQIQEVSETNNTLIKSVFILEDELKPVSPYIYAIVNKPDITFYAYATQLSRSINSYIMEIDTTELFNSPLKQTITKNGVGGIIDFKPNINYANGSVYYWRTSSSGGSGVWNNSSFLYNTQLTPGYNQSHYFQHGNNTYDSIQLKDDRKFHFNERAVTIRAKVGVYPFYVDGAINISRNEEVISSWTCEFNTLQIIVFDPYTSKPWKNYNVSATEGRYGSRPICHLPPYSFSYLFGDSSQRRKAMQFLDLIPDGSKVIMYWVGVGQDTWIAANSSFIDDWKADTAHLGSNNSLYHKIKQLGLTQIDSFTKNIPFLFFFEKGNTDPIYQNVGTTPSDYIVENFSLTEHLENGSIESPWFGPSLKWNELHWDGNNIDNSAADVNTLQVYGKDYANEEKLITTIYAAKDTSLSFIDSKQYPFLKLKLLTKDSVYATPYQLKFWRLNGELPPEGSLAPNVLLQMADTVELGQKLKFAVAFKNISDLNFDSLKIKVTITDKNNVPHIIYLPKGKPLVSGDTLSVYYEISTENYPGLNTLYIDFNTDDDQPEQYHFNNFLLQNFYVRTDEINPLLDVTIDGIHILNNDIISSKPHILIKLKDENRFIALDDTSLIKVQVKYPGGMLKTFNFNSDTLRFTPAVIGQGSSDNTATIDFNPNFFEDGDYQLIVSGRDKSGNTAGASQYTVAFKIINKPMISNMFNYPNPFTTSTAFVFTLTGSAVPQNLRIQILTITGKIVREITKQELGTIRIGRNITDFKWDGTDQFGQKLANGIYLYRVITNLNGKSLDKYKTEGDNTDQYFNKGYGKMYLMR
ncbi:MAG: C25 family cysteine peptidase [Agriterribacter sp.]